MILGFTGHRQIENESYVREKLIDHLKELKPTKCISGMALGSDLIFAQAAIDLNIPLIAAIPFKGQEYYWNAEQKEYYNNVLNEASEIIFVSVGGFASYKYQVRNEWIVNNSDILLAVYSGITFGGTYNCISFAKQVDKQIIVIEPC